MIIAVEGIDGAGKNTLVRAVAERLAAETLAFPRYEVSAPAQLARAALNGMMGDLADSAYGMASLFALDRAGAKSLLDAYVDAPDTLLILDRYVASNAAYTSARTGDDAAVRWVAELEFSTLGLPTPDLQILVDTPPEQARERAQRREASDASRARDRYERDLDLQEATYRAYAELAEAQWVSPWVRAADAQTIIQAVQAVK
ncbi:Thymidylate kinase [Corynebacterium capitovis DSM 44611]|uniref:dTMP kinase n=1 Tax=Corynebacterium capitovis TaxID=131081 RepID=UPI00035E3F84|nr:dTMP kinase [Corynebacterium capitovis]WKD57034.1 Thymidylate kinase [Corynebacterium capitovis DSM 44611]